ncbi:MAG: alpha/beta hydrolase [Pseudomonadota bacterium]|nr:alpha/beta hydrolase [Pseudomonadota bacterium]
MKMRRWAWLALLLAAGDLMAQSEPFKLGTLNFTDCDLKNRAQGELLGALCSRMEVPEDPAQPEGRKISLRIGLAKANTVEPLIDPVFFLAGGPGQSAVESFPQVAPGFARILEKRHVILVDQRGTGDSNALKCEGAEGKSAFGAEDESLAAQAAFVRHCLDALKGKADPRFYTTSVAVTDLDRVRAAIGADKINLIGGSYGTRAAQVYLRQFPERVRSIVLDGVVPPDLILGNEHARNLEVAVKGIFQRCRDNPACQTAFVDPAADLKRLQAELRVRAIAVDYRDPKSGEALKEDFTLADLGGVVRLFAYAPETAALLPLALHEAVNGRPEALLAQSRLVMGDLGEQIMHAMQLSVICSEDAPFFEARDEDVDTIMGTAFVEVMQAQCAAWPKGARPDDFHAPQLSDVPTLLLSGEFDPVTPPRYGQSTVKHFSKGRHLVAPGRGHGLMLAGCMPRLIAEFVEDADAAKLDIKCLKNLPVIPAFVNRNGWEP